MSKTSLSETSSPLITIIGCGFIGKKLIQRLLQNSAINPNQITAIVKSKESQSVLNDSEIQSLTLDLDNMSSELPEALKNKPDILYYFAPPPPKGDYDTRAKQFLQSLTTNTDAQPQKIVLISTTGVYGNCHGQWIDESTPLNPQVARAKRRVDAEQQFQTYCQDHSIPMVILRVSGIYGAGKLPLKRIKARTPIVREEDSPFSNRIHADDLTEICYHAGLDDSIEGIFNCADGHPTTMYDYFMRVAHSLQLPEPPAISLEQARTKLSQGMLSYMDESRRIDNKKLLDAFPMTLKYPDLESGLNESQ